MLLAFDTSMAACSAAVYDIDRARLGAARFLRMERGHADALAPMIKEVMNEAGLAFSDLARIAVTLGPGSFTGVRTGIAMARGLALALDRPVAGIDTLSAIAANAGKRQETFGDRRRCPAGRSLFRRGRITRQCRWFCRSVKPLIGCRKEASFILGTGSEALIAAAPPNRLVRLQSGDLPDARNFAARCAASPAFGYAAGTAISEAPGCQAASSADALIVATDHPPGFGGRGHLFSRPFTRNVLTMPGQRRSLPG